MTTNDRYFRVHVLKESEQGEIDAGTHDEITVKLDRVESGGGKPTWSSTCPAGWRHGKESLGGDGAKLRFPANPERN
jgi:hypothetical protein